MILEIDNAIRNINDIRKALLSLDGRTGTSEQTAALEEAGLCTSELEHRIRVLEYELNNG